MKNLNLKNGLPTCESIGIVSSMPTEISNIENILAIPSELRCILKTATDLFNELENFYDNEVFGRYKKLTVDEKSKNVKPLLDATCLMIDVLEKLGFYTGVIIGENMKK